MTDQRRPGRLNRYTISTVNAGWSLDARVLVRPAAAYLAAVDRTACPGLLTATRRPLFVALVLGCVMALLASSVVTARLAFPTAIYWAFVPLVEALAFLPLARRWRARVAPSVLIDTFFAGHAAWTLTLIVLGTTMTVVSPERWWFFITRVWLYAAAVVIAWSAYVDYWFWRHYLRATPGQALGRLAIHRAVVWLFVFWLFALPIATPGELIAEISEAIGEIAR